LQKQLIALIKKMIYIEVEMYLQLLICIRIEKDRNNRTKA